MIKKQIADDRAAQEARLKPTANKSGAKRTVTASTATTAGSPSGSCLIQVCNVCLSYLDTLNMPSNVNDELTLLTILLNI